MSISVVLAAYNGEKYIREQLDSIVCQLQSEDELIISLDPSSDHTEDIICEYMEIYKNIILVDGPGLGVIKNFENGLQHVKNEYIFLCDQDDVWLDTKVKDVLSCFQENVTLVLHDAYMSDEDLQIEHDSFFEFRGVSVGKFKNIIKNSYIGCCMAFKRELLDHILPFPKDIPMHDQYIGLVSECIGKNVLLKKPLIYYRRHGENVSNLNHSGFIQMIKWRIAIIRAVKGVKK